jgi:hypothetical protein
MIISTIIYRLVQKQRYSFFSLHSALPLLGAPVAEVWLGDCFFHPLYYSASD